MSKQILNIVFPPPSALFKNPCGFSPFSLKGWGRAGWKGEKSCGGSGDLSHLITRAGLKPGPLTIRCRWGHHTFPPSVGFSPDEEGEGCW